MPLQIKSPELRESTEKINWKNLRPDSATRRRTKSAQGNSL